MSLKAIDSGDFPELRPLLAPLMHTVCLVYANSSYYNTTARIIVLMQVGRDWEVQILINYNYISIIFRKLVIFSLTSQEDFSILPRYFKLR